MQRLPDVLSRGSSSPLQQRAFGREARAKRDHQSPVVRSRLASPQELVEDEEYRGRGHVAIASARLVRRRNHRSCTDVSPTPGLTVAVIPEIRCDARVPHDWHARGANPGHGKNRKWIANECGTYRR